MNKQDNLMDETDKLFVRNVPGTTDILRKSVVGIAGCGGLGSNAAISLSRAGVGKLVIVDFDKVELSNLNRQYYFRTDIGKYKVDALESHLKNINFNIKVDKHNVKINSENINIFKNVDILVEALDLNSEKQLLIEEWSSLFNKPIVCGNGLSGFSDIDLLTTKQYENLYFCGDFKSDMDDGLSAAKVTIVANMQAAKVIEILCSALIAKK